jgi:hypothetical protein
LKFSTYLINSVCTATLVVGSLLSLASSTLAETFTLNPGNVSLNTNNNFGLIDGQPRISLWGQNPNDPDQNFDRLNGNRGGVLFKNRSTGKCLNAYYNYNYGKVSNWPCDPNDPAQNFDVLNQGNNVVLLRKTGTNFCINSYQHYNGGEVIVWTCNANDVDQRFLMGGVAQVQTRTEIQNVNFVYKVYLASIRPTGRDFDSSGNTGHAWIGLVKFYSQDRVTYNGSQEVSRVRIVDGLKTIDSISAPGPNSPNYYVANDAAEIRRTNLLINSQYRRFQVPGSLIGYDKRGTDYYGALNRTISYYDFTISQDKYFKFLPIVSGGQGSSNNCTSYFLYTPYTGNSQCNCGSLALGIFKDATSNIIPTFTGIEGTNGSISPLGLSKDIDRLNGYPDWNINR